MIHVVDAERDAREPFAARVENGLEALNPDNLMCQAIKAAKDAVPEVGVLTDVALDPYTSHGHDGLVDVHGYVLNDETAAVLVEQHGLPALCRALFNANEFLFIP